MVVRPAPMVFSADLLARRLAEVASLSEYERGLLLHLKQYAHSHFAGATIVDSQSAWSSPSLIVSGWACRERILPNGRRQLLSILLPGDLIGVCNEKRALDLVEVAAISSVRTLSLASLIRRVEEEPVRCAGIANGIAALRFLEESRILDHMVRLGLQTAMQRTAGFLLELFERCRAIGFVTGRSFVMPLTQEMLGDALGISVVHVNRVIRELRARHLVDLYSGIAQIEDVAGLAAAAGFAPPDLRCLDFAWLPQPRSVAAARHQ